MEGRTTKMGYRKVWWLRCLSTLLWELWLVDLHPPIRKHHDCIWWTSHNRLGEIRIDSDSIWNPGIIFYNARNGQFSPEFKVKLRFIFKLIFKKQWFDWFLNDRQFENNFKRLFWWLGLGCKPSQNWNSGSTLYDGLRRYLSNR